MFDFPARKNDLKDGATRRICARPKSQEKADSSFLNRALDDYHKARKSLDALAEPETGSSTIHPQYVTRLDGQLAVALDWRAGRFQGSTGDFDVG